MRHVSFFGDIPGRLRDWPPSLELTKLSNSIFKHFHKSQASLIIHNYILRIDDETANELQGILQVEVDGLQSSPEIRNLKMVKKEFCMSKMAILGTV
jgi:hypothetical protein